MNKLWFLSIGKDDNYRAMEKHAQQVSVLPGCYWSLFAVCPVVLSRAGSSSCPAKGEDSQGSRWPNPRDIQGCLNLQLNQAKPPQHCQTWALTSPASSAHTSEHWQVVLGITKTKTPATLSLKLLLHQNNSPPSPWTNQPPNLSAPQSKQPLVLSIVTSQVSLAAPDPYGAPRGTFSRNLEEAKYSELREARVWRWSKFIVPCVEIWEYLK